MCDMQTPHVLDMEGNVRYADSTCARHEVEMCTMQTPHVLDMERNVRYADSTFARYEEKIARKGNLGLFVPDIVMGS